MHLTSQERMVLLWLLVVILTGVSVSFIFKRYPKIQKAIDLIDQGQLVSKLDVNQATIDQLVALPYIGEFTAKKIVHYRQQKGMIVSIEEIATIPGIRKDLYQKFVPYLKVNPI